ncbi:MAG: phage terminase family protein [Lachnospiraceae bacterium]|nr:phage terminase family protein [Lachnospiraceae bacterium]
MEKRIGRQEPTYSVIKIYTQTEGTEAIKLYNLTGRTALPWQEALIYDILAVDENGKYVHEKFGYEVPRRNGKGEVIVIRELYGLAKGEKIMHTAHLTSTSHSAFERLCGILDMLDVTYYSIKAKGSELIRLENGGTIWFRTRTAKGGLGEGVDLLVIDEAQEYTKDQQSALQFIVTDSKNRQTLMCGTPPTVKSAGTVFKDFRETCMTTDEEFDIGWAEWSIEHRTTDVKNRDLWYETNPSLGLTLDETAIKNELADVNYDEVDFNIQRLGFWFTYELKSAISKADWDELLVNDLPKFKGKLDVGIKYSKDGESVSMAVAVKTEDGHVFVEVLGNMTVRDGNGWIIKFLLAAADGINKIIIDGAGKQQILADELKDVRMTNTVLPKVTEVVKANAEFEKNVFAGKLLRMEQPSLTRAVTNCQKRNIGSQGGFGYTPIYDDIDITLVDAVILAAWAIETFKEPKKQRIYC